MYKIKNSKLERSAVETYAIPGSNATFKVTRTGDRYAFKKSPSHEGGDGRIFIGIDAATQQPYVLKEIRIKPSRTANKNWRHTRGEERGQRTLCENLQAGQGRNVLEAQNAWRVDRSFGPVGMFVNSKRRKQYTVQHCMSGTVSELVNALSLRTSRQAAVAFVAYHIALDLQEIHAKNVLHLDIRPANICFNVQQQTIELIDFGLSANSSASFPEGLSQYYASPEQRLRHMCDAKSDIFCLGVTFAELCLQSSFLDQGDESQDLVDLVSEVDSGKASPHVTSGYKEYMRRLADFDLEISALVKDMTRPLQEERLTMKAVVSRCEAISLKLDQQKKTALKAAWSALPQYSASVQARITEAQELLVRKNKGALKFKHSK